MWPFNRKPKRIIVHRYTALTGGGVRKKFEKDANKMASKGYRFASSVDHPRGRFYGSEMVATYELIEPT